MRKVLCLAVIDIILELKQFLSANSHGAVFPLMVLIQLARFIFIQVFRNSYYLHFIEEILVFFSFRGANFSVTPKVF